MKNRILIVDDEPAIADTLDYVLRSEGFEPVCVGLGQRALEEIGAREYALVILDVGLPDLSGFDVCRELRRHSAVPVLFLTARSDEVDRIVGLELGADDYLPKPCNPRELLARVRAVLRRRQERPIADGSIGATCEFCNRRYAFAAADARALFERDAETAPATTGAPPSVVSH